MPRSKETGTLIFTAAVFIVMEVAALALLSHSATLQNIWLNRFSHRIMALNWQTGENVRGHFKLREQNEQLAAENFALREELRRYQELDRLEEEEAHLAAAKGRFTYIPATIVKMSRNSLHNYIILDKGSDDGVYPHSGIISEQGVVGVVQAVGRRYSYGLTLMNSFLSVSARVGRDGLVAPLVWDGVSTRRGFLKGVPPHMEIPEGETVYTSGFSFVFPPDIPIAVTQGVSKEDGATNSVAVELLQDFSSLRYVTIVQNPSRAEITALEKEREEAQ
ncbi:MAG: rod shape-determining protein MreC [Bacteroidales bacterium]|nr:rod shape-determining protein MreC [Bacteroidales bacterium]